MGSSFYFLRVKNMVLYEKGADLNDIILNITIRIGCISYGSRVGHHYRRGDGTYTIRRCDCICINRNMDYQASRKVKEKVRP